MARLSWIALALTWLLASAAPQIAWAGPAEGLTASISADRTSTTTQDAIQLRLEVQRQGRGNVPSPALPDSVSGDFDVGRCSPGSMRMSGTFSGSKRVESLVCQLFAKKPGEYTLAFSVKEGRETVRSNAIKVSVSASTQVAIEDPTASVPTTARGEVFLWASADKVRAYVGQQVMFRLDVYEGSRFIDPHLRKPPTFHGFFAQDMPLPEARIQVVDGTRYRVRPGLRRALFPQKSGTLTIGEAEVSVGRRIRVTSDPIEIEVLPLPANGQPPGFPANNVGKYTLTSSADREELQPGEPFTFSLTLEGSGNIDVVSDPVWPTIEGARAYDPKSNTRAASGEVVGGTRTYEILLIPERPGTLHLPAHEVPYFDPEAAAYAVARSEPMDLLVGGDPNSVMPDPDAETDEVQGEPLAPVIAIDTVPRRVPREQWLTPDRWLYGMLAVPLLAIVGLGAGMVWRRYGPDEATRSRARVRQRRRERIEAAQAAVEGGDGFHAAVASLLQDVALERAGPEGVGLPRPTLLRLLEGKQVPADDRRRLERLLDACDAARFASVRGSPSDRQSLLEDAMALARSMDKGAG